MKAHDPFCAPRVRATSSTSRFARETRSDVRNDRSAELLFEVTEHVTDNPVVRRLCGCRGQGLSCFVQKTQLLIHPRQENEIHRVTTELRSGGRLRTRGPRPRRIVALGTVDLDPRQPLRPAGRPLVHPHRHHRRAARCDRQHRDEYLSPVHGYESFYRPTDARGTTFCSTARQPVPSPVTDRTPPGSRLHFRRARPGCGSARRR